MKRTSRAARLIFLAFGLAISSWAPLVPYTKLRLELDDAQLGMVLFVYGLGALFMMPLTGWLINQFGSRKITFLAGLAVITMLPFLAVAQTTAALCLILFLFGVSTGAMNVSINAQAVDIEIASQAPVMSGLHCWFSIGGLSGAVIVSSLLERDVDLLHCMLSVAIIFALLLLSQWRHLLPFISQIKEAKVAKNGITLPDPQVIFLGGLCFIAFMAEGSMLDWSAEYLRSNLNYHPALAAIGYALFSIAMAFGRFVGDSIIKKWGILFVFQTGSFLAASGFLMVINVNAGYGELIGFCLIGLGASNVVPILFSSAGRIRGVSSNFASSLITTCGYVGLLLGPAFIGFIAEANNLSLSFAVLAILLTGVGISGRKVIPLPSISES